MKLRVAALCLAITLLLSGCSWWLDGEYVSVRPHTDQPQPQTVESVTVSSYQELFSAIEEMVENGAHSTVLTVREMEREGLDAYMDTAIHNVIQNNPVAAYAVNTITYEIGTSTGATAIAVTASYYHGRNEIQRIRHVKGTDEGKELVTKALEQYETGIVLYVQDYVDTDFAQTVQDYALNCPAAIMEIPQVNVEVYPDTGKDRVVALQFVYQSSRESLRSMYAYVQPVFSSATLYVSGEGEDAVKYAQLYSFLMERNTYKVETSITPAYSLLRHGVGDSRAFATVYAAMCRAAGLEAVTVTGTRAGEPWFWNIVCCDGVYYHVDLLQSHRHWGYRTMTDREMNGYVWDYSAYPACG